MSNYVLYDGRLLGQICLDDNNRFSFAAEGLNSLETLFKLGDGEIINVEGFGDMCYSEFREKHLKETSGFYPTLSLWFARNPRARIMNDAESDVL